MLSIVGKIKIWFANNSISIRKNSSIKNAVINTGSIKIDNFHGASPEQIKRIVEISTSIDPIYSDIKSELMKEYPDGSIIEQEADKIAKNLVKQNIVNNMTLASIYELTTPEKAIPFYESAIKLSANNPDLLNLVGLSFLNQGKYQAAYEYFDKALHATSLSKITKEHILGNLGVYYKNKKEYGNAVQSLDSAIALAKAANNNIGLAKHINNKAACFHNDNNHQDAILELKSAIRIIRSIKENNTTTRIDLYEASYIESNIYANLSIAYRKKYELSSNKLEEDLDSSLMYIERGIDIATSQKLWSIVGRHHGNKSNIYLLKQDWEKQLDSLQTAMIFFRENITNNKSFPKNKTTHKDITTTKTNIGNCYIKMERYEDAINILKEALQENMESDGTPKYEKLYIETEEYLRIAANRLAVIL